VSVYGKTMCKGKIINQYFSQISNNKFNKGGVTPNSFSYINITYFLVKYKLPYNNALIRSNLVPKPLILDNS
jgi:hypothetical protein